MSINQEIPTKEVAKRDPVNFRYDIIDPDFIYFMARIAAYGAKKYGDFNWHKSRLIGDKCPINHIYKHLHQYITKQKYNHPEINEEYFMHLVAIAFNAMMEFYYAFAEFSD